MTTDMFHLLVLSAFMTYNRVCNQINTMGATSGAGTATFPEHLSSSPVFIGVRVTRSLVLCVCFVAHCLSFCTFSFCPLCCLFLFDIRILITPLVSSNSSYIIALVSSAILERLTKMPHKYSFQIIMINYISDHNWPSELR